MASNQEDSREGASPDVIDVTSKHEVRISRQDLPPSPPLTRSNSVASTPGVTVLDEDRDENDMENENEVSEEGWDPLQREVGGQPMEDETFVAARGGELLEAGDSVVDVNGRVIFSPGGNLSRSNLQLEFEPRPLQPWDLVDPPLTNGEKLLNPYGTVNSHKFSTLQDSAYVRRLALNFLC